MRKSLQRYRSGRRGASTPPIKRVVQKPDALQFRELDELEIYLGAKEGVEGGLRRMHSVLKQRQKKDNIDSKSGHPVRG